MIQENKCIKKKMSQENSVFMHHSLPNMQINGYARNAIMCNKSERCETVDNSSRKSTMQTSSTIQILFSNNKFSQTMSNIPAGDFNLDIMTFELCILTMKFWKIPTCFKWLSNPFDWT